MTSVWLDFLREIDRKARERERAKLAKMTKDEREQYLADCMINSIINMPGGN